MIAHDVRYVPAQPSDRASGLLGYVSFTVGGLRIDGTTVRRTRDGRYALSFAERRDSAGKPHPIIRPLTPAAREEIEEAVLGVLRRGAFIT